MNDRGDTVGQPARTFHGPGVASPLPLEGTDDAKGYVSLRSGSEPRVELLEDLAAERAFLVGEIQRLIEEERVSPSHSCVAARTHAQIDKSYGPASSTAGVDTEKLGRGSPRSDAIRLATMHRIEGLEFPVVFLVGVDRAHMPLSTPELNAPVPVVRAHASSGSAASCTSPRAVRDRLYVTASGKPSDFTR